MLLVLLGRKAAHDLLTQKVEALHTHVHALFAQPSRTEPREAEESKNSV
jgi:hypothetical protein